MSDGNGRTSRASGRETSRPETRGEHGVTAASTSVDPNLHVVRNTAQSRETIEHLLSPDRGDPAVGLPYVAHRQPLLDPVRVRAFVGPSPRIYLLANEQVLRSLAPRLGKHLALGADEIRVWWPGLTPRSEAREHPLIRTLLDEPEDVRFEEFALRFDLTRPRVRATIRELEDATRMAEADRTAAETRARAAERERERASCRAQVAETALTRGPAGQTSVTASGGDDEERNALLRAFGERLRRHRRAAGLSQDQLAASTFMSHDRISNLELGLTAPTLPLVLLLSEAVDVTAGRLLSRLPAPTRRHSREAATALLARRPELSTDQIAHEMGLPRPYVSQILRYMAQRAELEPTRIGWRLKDTRPGAPPA
jgi:ribosome-binding protein aMBF1 (putative translation factor)